MCFIGVDPVMYALRVFNNQKKDSEHYLGGRSLRGQNTPAVALVSMGRSFGDYIQYLPALGIAGLRA